MTIALTPSMSMARRTAESGRLRAMPQARRKTLRDLYRLPPETRAELIDGEIHMPPAPNADHQDATGALYAALRSFAKRHGGKTMIAPYDVLLPTRSVVEPDVLYVRPSQVRLVGRRFEGVPDLVVEVISPGSRGRDGLLKRRLYERNGVPEYWIVDPIGRSVTVLVLRRRRYETAAIVGEGERLVSRRLKGFAIAVKKVFEG